MFFMKESEDTFDVVVDKEYKYVPKTVKRARNYSLRLIKDINKC